LIIFSTVFSSVVVGGAAKLYTDHQDALKDQATRRTELGRLITEYQNRISDLADADGELSGQLGSDADMSHARPLDTSDRAAVARWDRLADRVSHREWDILVGRGDYAPTAPEFAGVSLVMIGTRMDDAAGIPDVQFGGLRMIGILNARPPGTWIFIRSLLPMLQRLGVSRSLLFTDGGIPLLRGQSLTARQEQMLGFPQNVSREENERLSREVSAHLNETIDLLETNGSVNR